MHSSRSVGSTDKNGMDFLIENADYPARVVQEKKSLSPICEDEVELQKITKKILWKLDTRVLPVLAILFLCSFLDRTNIGNAKILGLEEDLGLTDSQYANGLAIFFAFYIASEVPSNLVLKKASPRVWLPFLTVMWGIVGMCLGFVRNYAGFLVVRAFLGTAEGGLLPGMVDFADLIHTQIQH
jgi:sugar phosphate permease